jgi:hypothetical protein
MVEEKKRKGENARRPPVAYRLAGKEEIRNLQAGTISKEILFSSTKGFRC